MKRKIAALIILAIGWTALPAQKYAYVDTEYILDNIPEYKDAQNILDELSQEYQQEIEAKFGEVDIMYRNLQAEAVLMPDDIREKREAEIREAELNIKQLQNKRFGVGGDLFDKREELVRPIQEKIYNAIEEIATERNYAFVFDKAGSLTILFSSDKFDLSDDVLDMVGAELGTVRKEDRVKKEYKGGVTSPGTTQQRTGTVPTPPGNTSGPVQKPERK
jgi:outer membrane protein